MGEIIITIVVKSIWGILAFLAGIGASAIKGYYKDKKATSLGVQALLRHDILNISKAAMSEKCISFTDKEDLTHMYEAYTGLGGNGTIKNMMPMLNNLPVKED